MPAQIAPITLKNLDWDFAGVKTNHSTHGIHPYPAKYIPQIPAALIQALSNPQETVADIFCGSGTTLVEALSLGRNAVGVDANPLACLISEAKTIRLTANEVELLEGLSSRADVLAEDIRFKLDGLFASKEGLVSKAPRPDSDSLSFWFEPFVIEEIAEALSWSNDLPSESARKVARVASSSIIVAVSRQDSDTRYTRREKNLSPGETMRRFARAVKNGTQSIVEFNNALDSRVGCKIYDASVLDKPDIGMVDLVVCSPPYPNAFSYHLYHMTRMLWLGMDQPKFKREEIGSHRKYSSNGKNGATSETFKNEMETVFSWLQEHLRTNRFVCFVIGNSTIRGESIDNAQILSDAAQLHGFREVERLDRKMQETKKAFNPSHGRIKTEQILIFQKEAGAGL